MFATLQRQAADWFQAEGVAEDAQALTQVGLMRYHGQGGEITVPWTADPGGIEAAFVEAHQTLYGFTLNADVELVTLRVEATGRMPRPQPEAHAPGRGAVPQSSRPVHLADGWAEVPVYDRDTIGPGDSFIGPAIITQLDATRSSRGDGAERCIRPGQSC